MGNKGRIRTVVSIAGAEYVRWVTDPRMILLPVFCVMMRPLTLEPLLAHAQKMGQTIHMAEPFLAMGNSGLLLLMLPLLYLVLMGDYPLLDGNTLFVVQRTGKQNWLCGQFLFLVLAAVSFLACISGVSALFSGGVAGKNWSETVTKYLSVYPKEAGSYACQLLPANLYNQMTLGTALLHTLLLSGGYLLFLALILCLFRICGLAFLGLFVDVLLLFGGMLGYALRADWMWAFPMPNTLIWLHYTEILREPVYPIRNSYLYFGIGIAVLLLLNRIALTRTQFMEGMR